MYKEHPLFESPSDDSTIIWKYLKFPYFVSMLYTSSLFFAKPSSFEDTLEGLYSNANITEMNEILEKSDKNSIIAQNVRTLFMMSKRQREETVLNCWHMNTDESAAMWKLYSDDNTGISIQSSFGRLKGCFSECQFPVYIGKVNYINWNVDKIPQQNLFSPYLYKRRSFEHERELRALVNIDWRDEKGTYYIDKDHNLQQFELFTNNGVYVPISLKTLVTKIYISPKSPKWFIDLVKSVSEKYNLHKEIIQSNLYSDPLY